MAGLILLQLSACATPVAEPARLAAAARPAEPAQRPAANAWTAGQSLICTGLRHGSHYPYGKSPTTTDTLRVKLDPDPALTRATFGYQELTLICLSRRTPADSCKATQDNDALDIVNRSQMIITSLHLDKRTGVLRYGIGDMDGGMDFSGSCKAQ